MITESQRAIVENVTGIVATYERPEQLSEMISSFRSRYPGLKFVVADNGLNQTPRNDVTYLPVTPGSGISASRNIALDNVHTSFTLLVDDDHLCIPETRLEKLVELMVNHDLDLVAGNQLELGLEQHYFHGAYREAGRILEHYVGVPSASHPALSRYHVTPNFFVARTEAIREVGWDKNLRFAKEHDDFFLTARQQGLKISYLDEIEVLNKSVVKHHGGARADSCERHFLQKWGIDDKWEIRWMKHPHPRLSFYSTLHKTLIEPTRAQFERTSKVFADAYPDFQVLNPWS